MQYTLLSALLNALLNQQPHLKTRLATHAGRVFSLDFPSTVLRSTLNPLRFSILTDGNLICEALHSSDSDNLDLLLTLNHFPQAPFTADSLKSAVRLQGHADLADTLAYVLANLNVQLGDFIQPFAGDVLAHRADHLFAFVRRHFFHRTAAS